MGVYSHDPAATIKVPITRPPGMTTRRCSKMLNPHYMCGLPAMWPIIEVSYCMQHLPTEYHEVAKARRAMWVDYAMELWADIIIMLPIDDAP